MDRGACEVYSTWGRGGEREVERERGERGGMKVGREGDWKKTRNKEYKEKWMVHVQERPYKKIMEENKLISKENQMYPCNIFTAITRKFTVKNVKILKRKIFQSDKEEEK